MSGSESLKNIEVKAYSGFKGNERPLSFIVMGLDKKVLNILDRWLGPDKDYFKVLADDGMIYTLSWNRETDAWNIEKISVVPSEN